MARLYTGFDIGSDTLKAVVCDGTSIKDIVLAHMPDGMVADGRVVSMDAMADFIKEATAPLKGASKQAAFVIPQADSLTRRLHIPAMTVNELEINLPYEFRDYITQGKDKYSYDYAVLKTETLPDGKPESFDLLAVAASKQVIADYTSMFRRAGFKLSAAMPVAAALQNLIQGNQLALPNCCIIDFSHTSTMLHFFVNGTYDVSRSIETGLADIDRAIADTENVDTHMAASYRQNDFQGVLAGEAVQGVYESIAIEVGRALNFYGFNNPDASIEIAYLSGEGMMVSPLVNAVASAIDLEKADIASIMPPAQNNDTLRAQCPEAVGVTLV